MSANADIGFASDPGNPCRGDALRYFAAMSLPVRAALSWMMRSMSACAPCSWPW